MRTYRSDQRHSTSVIGSPFQEQGIQWRWQLLPLQIPDALFAVLLNIVDASIQWARREKALNEVPKRPAGSTFRMARVRRATLARSVGPVPRKRESGCCKLDLAYAAQVHTLLGMPQIIVVLHCQPAFRRTPERFG